MIEFSPLDYPIEWRGHYERPVGYVYVYHVDSANHITIQAYKNGCQLIASVVPSPEVEKLARSINLIKRRKCAKGKAGGSFAVNEQGCVIVPIAGISTRYFVGTLRGRLQFTCSAIDYGLPFDLSGDGMEPGSIWPYPYVGMKYHLSAKGNIYRIIRTDTKETPEYSQNDNSKLIEAIRGLRGRMYEPVSFLVTADGAVLVKKPDEDGTWNAHFVQKVTSPDWF